MKRLRRFLSWLRDDQHFYVRYMDGRTTCLMYYEQADNLADVFKGELKHISEGYPWAA